MFDCHHCGAHPETLRDRAAAVSVVRHAAGCETLAGAIRRRWSTRAAPLPATPPPQRFAHHQPAGKITLAMCAEADRRRRAAR